VPKASEATITRAVGVVGLATRPSHLFGYVREVIITQMFGASMAADAFFAALALPNLWRRMVGEGALSAAIVPKVIGLAFYALQDTTTPVRIGLYAMVLNLVLSAGLMGPLRHGGLALAPWGSSGVPAV
jgi:putative peptidoglycan lipid II flippase